ncbi:hypothetical protein N7540_000862 [Penicillium herquei]|nr:hypothetical protein N7540_000862 [Penicillium herquei]
MTNTETVAHHWRGSFKSGAGYPSMGATHISVANEARQQIVQNLLHRPGTAHAEYNNFRETKSKHGRKYVWNGEEEIKYSDEDSHTRTSAHGCEWTGTATVDIKAQFTVDSV